jgi:hypothetical protein
VTKREQKENVRPMKREQAEKREIEERVREKR